MTDEPSLIVSEQGANALLARGAWTVANGALYFSNDSDRRLYRLDLASGEARPITPEGAYRWADGIVDGGLRRRGSGHGYQSEQCTPSQHPGIIVAVTRQPYRTAG